MKGKFIVLEGGHGSGKTMLSTSILNYLRNKNKSVILTKEPFNPHIKSIVERLSTDDTGVMANLSILYLLSADRFLHVKYIQEKLKEYDFVVSDRYVVSSFVYQQMQGISLKAIKETNTFCIRPDLTFYIDVPFHIRSERSKKRLKQDSFFRRRYNEEELLYQQVYEQLFEEYNIIKIEGNKNREDIEKEVEKLISEKFL